MKIRLINRIIISFFASTLCFLSVHTNVFAEVDPGEYHYLRHWLEDEYFMKAYTNLLKDLKNKGLPLEIGCAKGYCGSFSRFKFKRDQMPELLGVITPISTGLSVFSPGGCEKLMEAMGILCRKEYSKFSEGYSDIPTIIYGSGDQEIASKKLCYGKYEIKLSKQGSYIIIKHFQ